ncbi:hypothetical protein AOLI_G00173310 [Acnodon oligacanthus]
MFRVMPQTRRKTVSGKRSTKKQRTGPVEIEDREMSNEEPDKDVDMDPVLLPEISDEEKKYRVSREEVCVEDTGPESTDDTPSSSSTSSSSDDGHPQKRKHGKKKEKLLSREKQLQGQSGTRARTPEVVLKRYKMTLKAFKKEGSMNRAFKKVGVDRNSLTLTAVVAELQMMNPDFFKSVPKFSPGEKLIDFSRRCQEVLTADVRSAINVKKSAGLSLPITYKLK